MLGHHRIQNGKDRGRNKNAQRTASHDGSNRDLVVVATLEHRRQCNDAHGYNRSTDHPDHSSQKSGGQYGCRCQTAAKPAHPFVDHAEHFLDQAGTFQHGRHENKQGNRGQIGVGHHREDSAGYDVQHHRVTHQIDEQNPEAARHEGQRQAHHQSHEKRAKHQVCQWADFDTGKAACKLEEEFLIAERIVEQDVDHLDADDQTESYGGQNHQPGAKLTRQIWA